MIGIDHMEDLGIDGDDKIRMDLLEIGWDVSGSG
jgi:hypothetical protein